MYNSETVNESLLNLLAYSQITTEMVSSNTVNDSINLSSFIEDNARDPNVTPT